MRKYAAQKLPCPLRYVHDQYKSKQMCDKLFEKMV